MKRPKFLTPKAPPEPLPVLQTVRASNHPFSVLDRYVPLQKSEFALYDAIREAVPIIDAAILKIVALVGGFQVTLQDKQLEKQLQNFLQNVPIGGCQYGMDAFLAQHFEQLLMYGTSVGEILPTATGRGIGALCNVPLQNLEIEKDPGTVDAKICVRNAGESVPLPHQDWLVMSALNPKPGQVCGTSLLKGLPFVTGILLKIYNTIGVNFQRVGNVRFAVNYKPTGDTGDRAFAKERANQIARAWQDTMRKTPDGSVSDFIAVGDVDIKVIGSDNQILDSNVPVRQMLEQIVAKTGIPPFMLGLSWSSTERMSSQQADMLTSELWAYRRQLNPMIHRICRLWLNLQGRADQFEIVWDEISLQDEVAMANAAYTRAQTKLLEQETEETN